MFAGQYSSLKCFDPQLEFFSDAALTVPWINNPADPKVEL